MGTPGIMRAKGRKILPDERTLREWAAMTDSNDHLELRVAIAEHFGDGERASFFRHMITVRDDEVRHAPTWYSIAVIDVTDGMVMDIAKRYGDSVAAKVVMCL